MEQPNETAPKTAGIPPAPTNTPLAVLQFRAYASGDLGAAKEIDKAAMEVVRYHQVRDGQSERYADLEQAAADFLAAIVMAAPPGPERSTAISRAREAKMWASCAISTER